MNDRNRRDFIKSTSAGMLGIGLVPGSLAVFPEAEAAAGKVRVAVVRNERAVSTRNVCNPVETRKMVDKALEIVTGKRDPREAWASLGVVKEDVVGIKVNCNSWTFRLTTHPELVYALCDSLSSVVRPNNIIIYERYTGELTRAGYRANTGTSGVRCFGTEEGGGFGGPNDLTRIVTDTCTKIINVPSLKAVDGEFAASLFLKNHIGTIPPPQMSRCHGYARFCTEVCATPALRNKTILAVCDGLRGTYKRGVPWYWGGIVVSRDQVAAEYVSLQVINEKRKAEKVKLLSVPSYVTLAETSYHLGTCNPGRIEVVKTTL